MDMNTMAGGKNPPVLAGTLVLHGSARIGGTTDALASCFLEGLGAKESDVSHFRPSAMNIAHCRACMKCSDGGGCVINDDMRDVYPALGRSRIVVVATPMFWGYMTSQLKTLFDRLEAVVSPRYFGGRDFVLLIAYHQYYGSMVEWMTRITKGFDSTLHWMEARTLDPATGGDIPLSSLADKMDEARALGRAVRARIAG